jgi:hypothetical protein
MTQLADACAVIPKRMDGPLGWGMDAQTAFSPASEPVIQLTKANKSFIFVSLECAHNLGNKLFGQRYCGWSPVGR